MSKELLTIREPFNIMPKDDTTEDTRPRLGDIITRKKDKYQIVEVKIPRQKRAPSKTVNDMSLSAMKYATQFRKQGLANSEALKRGWETARLDKATRPPIEAPETPKPEAQ
jgi:hypothetical protein